MNINEQLSHQLAPVSSPHRDQYFLDKSPYFCPQNKRVVLEWRNHEVYDFLYIIFIRFATKTRGLSRRIALIPNNQCAHSHGSCGSPTPGFHRGRGDDAACDRRGKWVRSVANGFRAPINVIPRDNPLPHVVGVAKTRGLVPKVEKSKNLPKLLMILNRLKMFACETENV